MQTRHTQEEVTPAEDFSLQNDVWEYHGSIHFMFDEGEQSLFLGNGIPGQVCSDFHLLE